jgi:exopolysaccharide biosynthesis polyprenyl glycosylphosphotransferase
MEQTNIAEETLKPLPILKATDRLARTRWKRILSPYKLALFSVDLISCILTFGFYLWLVGLSIFPDDTLRQFYILVIFSLTIISFFPTYYLYTYHRIFSSKNHLINTAKSYGWGLVSIGIIIFMYIFPVFPSQELIIIPMIFFIAIGLLILSRFLGDQFLNFLKSVGIGFLAIGLIEMVSFGKNLIFIENWWAILIGILAAAAVVLLNRYLLVSVVFNRWLRRRFRKQIAVVGSDEEAKRITNQIIEQNAPFWVVGIVGSREVEHLDAAVPKVRLGGIEDLPVIVEKGKISEIIVTNENIDKRVLITLLDYCTSEGINVWFPPKLMPIIDMKLYIDMFCGIPMIRLCSQKHTWVFNKIKHGLDALAALVMFLLLLPVFLLISFAIKVNSKGPVFYRATAVGKDGKGFTMYKFRSMQINHSNEIHKNYVTKLIKGEICKEEQKDGILKVTDDPRVTSVGRILRKFSLDELPQLINVLKGDMSLVGPRPCLPYEHEIYKDWHKKRLSIRPGITCLWQVAGRSEVAFEDMVLLDLYYIYNRSLLMDMNILYETVFAVLGKHGAY